MVCDFFNPNTGGVESHIYLLSTCLVKRGHRVVIVTHQYDDRRGVRYLSSGIKVYYLPIPPVYNQCIFPSMLSTLPLLRTIFIREEVTIVHGHSAFSTLSHEALLHAGIMGIRTVFTDHSLFGFADGSSIITNKVLVFSLANVSHAICVSHTSKENTVLRSEISPHRVSVIPNAVDTGVFRPDQCRRSSDEINIVVISRLVYRKGMDLLAAVIPMVTSKYPNVNFLIGGDGPKRVLLEEVREQNHLHDRVTFLGTLNQSEVREVLCRGDILINTSLTEAFCMAIVEAASCGLQVVSTKVGGIPEVLPPDLIYLVEPDVNAVLVGVEEAIRDCRQGKVVSRWDRHERVKAMYSWENIAERTETVYDGISKNRTVDRADRLLRYYNCGSVAGKLFVTLAILDIIFLALLVYLIPDQSIEKAACFRVNQVGSMTQPTKDR